MTKFLSKVAAAGYRVVAQFMRGYPPTSLAPDGDYGAATLGRDVIGLIDALDAVGHFPQLEAPDRVADAIVAFLATR
jgi:pimeloyl-ACP methyl ester carboxylesterase